MALTDGAITAAESNQSPISAAGGGKPHRAAASATVAQHRGGAAQIAEPLDPHPISVTES